MKKLLLMVSIFICSTITAATYYISPTGNDVTGNGTSANPWKTLSKATSAVTTSGSIIHVNAGTYLETQTSNLSKGVSLEGDGVTSIIKSSFTTDWVPIIEMSSPEGTDGAQSITNLKFDGQIVGSGIAPAYAGTAWGIHIAGRKNVSIHHCTIINFRNAGVLFWGRADNLNGPPTIYATGNTFHDNIVTNCAEYSHVGDYGAGCLGIGGQEGMLIYNNVITQDSRPCGYNGWCIKYANDGYTRGLKIYNNIFNKVPCCNPVGLFCWDFAIELFNNSGMEISNNQFNGGSIDLNYQTKGTYAYSVWIHHNTITMPYINSIAIQSGIILEYSTEDCIIEDNIIDKATIGISFTPRSGSNVRNMTIRRNLIKNGGFGEGTGFHIHFGGGDTHIFENIDIYNNTFVMDPIKMTWWGISLPSATSGYIRNINIKNNIIGNSLAGGIVLGGGTIPIENLHIQYNDIYNNGGNNQLVNDGNSPAPGVGYLFTNNINITPTFTGNFLLPIGSPLINAGINVGLPFSGTAPEIGYWEFGSALPIKLYDFSGMNTFDGHLLKWQTSSEINSDYFDIQISNDGITYNTINRVFANGYPSSYSFTNNNFGNVTYYRLLMIDKNGFGEYSNVITLKNSSKFIINIIKNNLYLMINSFSNRTSNVVINDVMGRVVFNKNIRLLKGNNVMNLTLPLLSPGVYYVRVIGEDRISKSFIVN